MPQLKLLFSVLLLPALIACSSSNSSDTKAVDAPVAYAYVEDGPYAEVLRHCVMVGTVADSCTLKTLPLIGLRSQSTADKDTIMQHVLVTHDWMGERFAQLLDSLPEDIRLLLGAITAIYIGSDVRPSFYSTLNGAIHLDPQMLWLSNAEKQTVAKDADYRSAYGADLQFDFYRRFVKDGDYAWGYFSLDDSSERELQDIRLPMARLLFHELAHANDFLPRSEHTSLDPTLSVYDAVDSVRSDWRAPQLQADYPLNSSELKSLAQVRYRGISASQEDMKITSDYAGALLEQDGSVYFYGYSTEAEELAGLFVAVMMKYHFDVSVDIAFVDKPQGSLIGGCQLPVGWGKHHRLANPLVATRAAYASALLLGENPELEAFLQQQRENPSEQELVLTQGAGWCSTLID